VRRGLCVAAVPVVLAFGWAVGSITHATADEPLNMTISGEPNPTFVDDGVAVHVMVCDKESANGWVQVYDADTLVDLGDIEKLIPRSPTDICSDAYVDVTYTTPGSHRIAACYILNDTCVDHIGPYVQVILPPEAD
jgi:hypothetical protein